MQTSTRSPSRLSARCSLRFRTMPLYAASAIAAQSVIGNSNAGAVASAEERKHGVVESCWHVVHQDGASRSGISSRRSDDTPQRYGIATGARPVAQGEGGDAGHYALIPQLYAAFPLGKSFAAGIAINSPFGLKTNYEDEWAVRRR